MFLNGQCMWYPAKLSAICTCSKPGNNNFCCALKHFCIQLLWYFRFLKHARKGSTTAMSAQKRQAPAARPRSANSKTRSKMTKIPRGARIIRQGYPSKVVDISEDCKPLSSLPFRSGILWLWRKIANYRRNFSSSEWITSSRHSRLTRKEFSWGKSSLPKIPVDLLVSML